MAESGGIVFVGKATLSNSTVTGNTATTSGGAIFYGGSGQHIIDLRTALADAYVAAALTPPTYTDAVLTSGVTVVRAVHIGELRAGVKAIE